MIGCQASRVIYVCGECARLAARPAVELALRRGKKLYDSPVREDSPLFCREKNRNGVCRAGYPLQKQSIDRRPHRASPEMNPASFGAHFAEVTVDTLTGLVKSNKYLAVHDIGQAINRSFVKGQIYGGAKWE